VLKTLSSHAERPRILTIEPQALGLEDDVPVPATELPVLAGASPVVKPGEGLKETVDAFQTAVINDALTRHQGRWSEVARELNLDRANLSRLAKRLGIR
jgi:anaerobic nitric oxide reductase transcription regulator